MKSIDFSEINKGMETSPSMSKHIQEGMVERFEAVVKAIGNSPSGILILHGCVFTVDGSNYSMTPGALYYQGKIYTVDAFEGVSSGGSIPVFSAVTTTFAGPKSKFGDSLYRDVTGTDKMMVVMGASGSGIVDYNLVNRYSEKANLSFVTSEIAAVIATLATKSNIDQGAWSDFPYFNDFSHGGDSNQRLRVRKTDAGLVTINGRMTSTVDRVSDYEASMLTFVPEAFRPSRPVFYHAFYMPGSGFAIPKNFFRMTIWPNGMLTISIKGQMLTDDYAYINFQYYLNY